MSLPFLQANAFTSSPFSGNPAAVVLLDEEKSGTWLQLVAREFNLSETAFLLPHPAGSGDWNLRWFTPLAEVDLCGHATLAAAHALREWGRASRETVRFHTRSGVMAARFEEPDFVLDFPSTPPVECEMPAGLEQVLGLARDQVLWCGRSPFDIVLQLDSEKTVARLRPDFRALAAFETRGVAVTASADFTRVPRDVFILRFFAPRLGIDEDPVTGSAICALTPFWAKRLRSNTLLARQLSARGGEAVAQVHGSRVELRGRCVSILRGEILA